MKYRPLSLKSFNVRTTYGLRRSRNSNGLLTSLIETMNEFGERLSSLEGQQQAALQALGYSYKISRASVRRNLN